MKNKNVVLAMTGASGAVYGVRLLEVLVSAGYEVYLSITPSAAEVLKQELDMTVDLNNFTLASLQIIPGSASDSKLDMLRTLAGISTHESNVLAFDMGQPGSVHYCHYENLTAPIASGSFLTAGMIICPCSMSTLGAVVHGMGDNLIQRAASVHLKEHRKLILVPRETPLSLIHLDNLRRAAEAGAVVLPAMPGFYHGVKSIRDLIDFVVARICDQLGMDNSLIHRWGT